MGSRYGMQCHADPSSQASKDYAESAEDQKTIYSMLRLIGLTLSCFEEVVAFLLSEETADMSNGLPECVVGPSCRSADQGLDQAHAFWRSARGLGHLRLQGSFVEITNAWQQVAHESLVPRDPDMTWNPWPLLKGILNQKNRNTL